MSLLGELISAAPPRPLHGGEGGDQGVKEETVREFWQPRKGGLSPSVHAFFKETIRSSLKGMQGMQLSSWVSEKTSENFL